MNYYPSTWATTPTATRHLSWDEDAAYRKRLLDAYYTARPMLPTCARCSGWLSRPAKTARGR